MTPSAAQSAAPAPWNECVRAAERSDPDALGRVPCGACRELSRLPDDNDVCENCAAKIRAGELAWEGGRWEKTHAQ